jgi:hypothetical protein
MDLLDDLSRTPTLLSWVAQGEIADLRCELAPDHPMAGGLRALARGGPRSSQVA